MRPAAGPTLQGPTMCLGQEFPDAARVFVVMKELIHCQHQGRNLKTGLGGSMNHPCPVRHYDASQSHHPNQPSCRRSGMSKTKKQSTASGYVHTIACSPLPPSRQHTLHESVTTESSQDRRPDPWMQDIWLTVKYAPSVCRHQASTTLTMASAP
jgi:hypothetical protein